MIPFCDECQATGYVDCRCGGDLCLCGEDEIPCPVCTGEDDDDE